MKQFFSWKKFLTVSLLISLLCKDTFLVGANVHFPTSPNPLVRNSAYPTSSSLYAVKNKGTGHFLCTQNNEPHLLNPNHWWTVRSVGKTYEITNFGTDYHCEKGNKLNLTRVEGAAKDVFLLSSEFSRGIYKCSGKDMYHGVFTFGNETIPFYGTLDFNCTSARHIRQNANLTKLISISKSMPHIRATPYHFHLVDYTVFVHARYEVLGHLDNFTWQDIPEIIPSNTTKIDQSWQIGFSDVIENCSNFPQKRKVNFDFQNNETTQTFFSQENLSRVNKLSSLSVSVGVSVEIPTVKLSPSFGVKTGKVWTNRNFEAERSENSEFSSVTRSIQYQYSSTVTVSPWTVAHITDSLSVVKDFKLTWEADVVVKLRPRRDLGYTDCLQVDEIAYVLDILGYNVPPEAWNETEKGFIFPFSGYTLVSFATQSYIEVTEEPCPKEKRLEL